MCFFSQKLGQHGDLCGPEKTNATTNMYSCFGRCFLRNEQQLMDFVADQSGESLNGEVDAPLPQSICNSSKAQGKQKIDPAMERAYNERLLQNQQEQLMPSDDDDSD